MKWSNDSLWLISYGKYFDHEMVEWYHMENILTMRWSNDFIRHLPYNETWIIANIHVDFCYFSIVKDYVTGLKVLAGYYTICSKVAL